MNSTLAATSKPFTHVVALHTFPGENDDEIAFVRGEIIQVVEKDEEFGDGWWTVSLEILI